MSFRKAGLLAGVVAAFSLTVAHAQDTTPTELGTLQVTATRDAEPIAKLPASVSVVSGDELRARGATDLRSALALVAGVEGTPTGDAGPAGSVPSLWGLREVDAFLLVIDGVPAGGAFNPAVLALDLTGVERIEVLRGAAPVMYGATSFNGVIHVIHYAAGEAPSVVGASGGTESSYGAQAYGSLPAVGSYRQSYTANVEQRGYSVDRMESTRYHVLYRGATAGGFRMDVELSRVEQVPGSVTWRNGATFRSDIVPADANHNPSDAKMDQTRGQVNVGFDLGAWSTTLSLAKTKDENIRGFHEANATTNAHGYEQEREITDLYFDSHLAHELAAGFKLTYGVDYLYGVAEQEAFRFPYAVGIDGSNPMSSAQGRASCPPVPALDECVEFETEVERNFAGLYAQTQWDVTDRVQVLAGLRLNQTGEVQEGEDDSTVPPTQKKEEDSNTRFSGVLGASWGAWRDGNDALTLYADYRNTFKPLAAELAPEPEVDILQPETATSYEAGFKGNLADGRLHYDASVFRLNFKNMKTLDTSGNTVNAGETRFQGGEVETRLALVESLQAVATYAYHDTKFIHFNRDGTPGGVVDGNRFELAPYHQAAGGLMYTPAQGFNASLLASHTGERVLNKGNTLHVGGFTTYDAALGWQAKHFGVQLVGENLTDRRDPIAESELSGEISGASSYYLLPGRRVLLNVKVPL
jgi:iron complex outermembrane recepter protein